MEQDRVTEAVAVPISARTLLERLDLGVSRLGVGVGGLQDDGVDDPPQVRAEHLRDLHHRAKSRARHPADQALPASLCPAVLGYSDGVESYKDLSDHLTDGTIHDAKNLTIVRLRETSWENAAAAAAQKARIRVSRDAGCTDRSQAWARQESEARPARAGWAGEGRTRLA